MSYVWFPARYRGRRHVCPTAHCILMPVLGVGATAWGCGQEVTLL